MRALSSCILTLVMAALPVVCSPAGNDKTLTAIDGSVSYGTSPQPTTKLAKNASAQLTDNDYMMTGPKSLANLVLPDSSVIKIGENSNVQMQQFDNVSGTAKAVFVLSGNSKVRFTVEHPQGAKANYTFQTPTGQIAVRGTVGDIATTAGQGGGAGGLQVNVYSLGSIANPVQVTLVNGQVFTLAAGQSLVVTAAAGALVAGVGAVSQTSFAPFTQLGAPANASSLGISSTAAGTTAAGTTTAAAAAGTTATVTTAAVAVGTAAAVTVATQNTAKDTPTPAPTPTATPTPTIAPTATPTPTAAPTGTSVPITISGKPGIARTPAPPAPPAPPVPGNVAPGGPGTAPTQPHPFPRRTPGAN